MLKQYFSSSVLAVVDEALAASLSCSKYFKSFEASKLLVPVRVYCEREVLASESPEPATEKDSLPIYYVPHGYVKPGIECHDANVEVIDKKPSLPLPLGLYFVAY